MLIHSDVQKFLEEGENQNTKRRTESYVFSGFGVAILAAENENRLLDVLPRADFVRLERFLLSVREKCITEDFVH